jgi:hypothetical protein
LLRLPFHLRDVLEDGGLDSACGWCTCYQGTPASLAPCVIEGYVFVAWVVIFGC